MRFKPLHIPDTWKHYWTKYPEGYTVLESLLSWVSQVNAMVDAYNELDKNVTDRIEGFEEELQAKLTEIQNYLNNIENVTFPENIEAIINKLFNNGELTQLLYPLLESNNMTSKKARTQTNFSDLFNDPKYTDVYAIARANEIELYTENGYEGVGYTLVKDPNDEFHKLGRGFYYKLNENYEDINPTTQGTWNTSTNNQYTTELGATFTVEYTGTKVILPFNSNNQGGIWSLSIDGVESKQVSTYADSTGTNYFDITIDLPFGEHKIVGIFKGQDPAHPVETPRGWLRNDQAKTRVYKEKNRYNIVDILHPTSNKDFAFTFSHNGDNFWVPEHNGRGTAYNNTITLFIDGSVIPLDQMTLGEKYQAKSIFVRQQFEALTEENGLRLATFMVVHHLGLHGNIQFNGSMQSIRPLTITRGYPAMLPVDGEVLSRVQTSFGNLKNTEENSEYHYFEEEKDEATGGLFTTTISGYGSYYAFIDITSPPTTMRYNYTGKPNIGESIFLWQRPKLPKLYFQSMENVDFESGQGYKWGGRIGVGLYQNISQLI